MRNSKIEWTDHTFNPWIGCTKVSPGCLNCYAESLNNRWGKGTNWGNGAPRKRTSKDYWKEPLKWNISQIEREEQHKIMLGFDLKTGEPLTPGPRRPRVFCASMADWLDPEVPVEWRADLLTLIHRTQNLDWLLLTKRPELCHELIEQAQDWHFDHGDRNVAGWLSDWRKHGIAPANVWIGTSAEDQMRADIRMPYLLSIPARVHFLSVEPMIEQINLYATGMNPLWGGTPGGVRVDWVICGGESGPCARPMDIEWARDLHQQCACAGCAFFMKQLGGVRDKRGAIEDFPEDLRVREFPKNDHLPHT